MTLLKIACIGHPVLRQRARELGAAELKSSGTQTFIDDLLETMEDAHGAGIAAPQVHRSIRVCVVHVQANPRYPYMPEIPLTIMVNPVITPLTLRTFENYEGCLSVPNLRGLVSRPMRIQIQYQDRFGKAQKQTLAGLTASVFQHEVDHLDGKLFVDRVADTASLTNWADFERFHMAAFVARMTAWTDDEEASV